MPGTELATGGNAVQRPAADIWGYLLVCQIGWFVAVVSAAHGKGWIGFLYAVSAVIVHLVRCADSGRETRFLAVAIVMGWCWECMLVRAGLLVYPGARGAVIAPYWMTGLWALFAIQFNVLLVWLRHRRVLAALLGALAGPMSFRAGAALGAVHFPNSVAALLVLGVGWAVFMPLLLTLSQYYDGVNATQRFSNE